jgi:hypothetical protein
MFHNAEYDNIERCFFFVLLNVFTLSVAILIVVAPLAVASLFQLLWAKRN